jgi:DNA-binding MarR family transcriptional regulator
MAARTTNPTLSVARTASELRLAFGQLVRRLRVEHNFAISHASVLGRLDREGPRTTSALAAAERVRPQSMAQTVSDLHADGLVARRPDPLDGRQILIELTDLGRQALSDDRRRRDGWLAQAIASELTVEEREILVKATPLLHRLAQSDPGRE